MSVLEPEPGQVEQRSSIKLVRNAKGDCQIEVKVYAGEDAEELTRIRELAVANYKAVEAMFYGAVA